MKQTAELFKNGRVTSDGGRGRMFANGTAFVEGTAFNNINGDGSFKNEEPSDSDKFEADFDWIETLLSRLERTIDNLDKTVNNTYKSWSDRNNALADEISSVGKEIKTQNLAADAYLEKAESIGLSNVWKKRVQDGLLSIEDESVIDEDTSKKIEEYKKWYELYLDCIDKAEDLKQVESELYTQRFELIQSQYDGILQGYEHTEAMLDEYISQAEARGHIVSKKYYNALIENEKSNIAELKKEQSALINARDEAVASGAIVKESQAWFDMCSDIDEVTQAIEKAETATIEWANAIRDIEWEIFDLIQEQISDVTSEADFLIELMSNEKLLDDNGKLTDKGMATAGLHGQNYNTYMYQASVYGEQIKDIDDRTKLDPKHKDYLDPLSKDVIEKRRELVELQRESILNAEQEKQSIKSLIEEGYEKELDLLQEKIDKTNEAIDSQKDLLDYQRKVKDTTKNIASLEKQLRAYEGFNDEESRAKVQKIKLELESERQDLKDSEFDRYATQQSQLLDSLYNDYELMLNQRLDDTNALVSNVIAEVNANATTISNTLTTEAKNVGTTISDTLQKIWNGDGESVKSVLSTNNAAIIGKEPTSIRGVLDSIRQNVNAMVDDVDKDATTKTTANKTATSAKKNPTTSTPSKTNAASNKQKITNDTLKGIAAAIWCLDDKGGWADDPTRKNKLANKLGTSNAKKVQDIINQQGINGELYTYWAKTGFGNLNQYRYNAFKLGAKNIDETQLAWTQENGREFIVRPSDGAILTPIAKGDSVLTSAASNNIWDMANSPADFIKDNLNLGTNSVPNNSNINNSYSQHIDNVVFRMDNVKNYEELLSAMQKDKNFERLILSMSIDRLAGKSSLAKGKSIR